MNEQNTLILSTARNLYLTSQDENEKALQYTLSILLDNRVMKETCPSDKSRLILHKTAKLLCILQSPSGLQRSRETDVALLLFVQVVQVLHNNFSIN